MDEHTRRYINAARQAELDQLGIGEDTYDFLPDDWPDIEDGDYIHQGAYRYEIWDEPYVRKRKSFARAEIHAQRDKERTSYRVADNNFMSTALMYVVDKIEQVAKVRTMLRTAVDAKLPLEVMFMISDQYTFEMEGDIIKGLQLLLYWHHHRDEVIGYLNLSDYDGLAKYLRFIALRKWSRDGNLDMRVYEDNFQHVVLRSTDACVALADIITFGELFKLITPERRCVSARVARLHLAMKHGPVFLCNSITCSRHALLQHWLKITNIDEQGWLA
jgi:hypothetical protein